ncbi:CG31988 [Drosophila busckii]|uniref:CG31988 n=1 Tax=Drosophila busckii TaxID=30019 RepID=A0A0M4EXY2_DROBS|nr:paxillin-B [Drosophila busckii]ALC48730.1 CG31988 [Drosophila busckii]
MSAKVCCKCHEAVSRRAINALGKIYHPHHFTCKECDKPIVDAVFNVQKGEPVCQSCYQEKYASRCHCCGTLIMERAIVAAKRKWHEKCFRCVRCRKSLIKSNFFEVNGYLFCKHDYRKLFSSRCASCEQPIGGNATIALNTKWHAECFRCLCCQQPIGGDFAIYNGDPVCANCVNRFSVY